ncbi:MAG TPA: hypothetical protein VKR32_00535 [Puia sp.]|nr:hypothetical protein [Puia sp.]
MNKINWTLIFQLSIFGLIMAAATISLIPQIAEPFIWLVIFLFVAYVIAKKATGKFFLHGLLVSLVNSIWITAAHVLFASSYLTNHPQMQEMMANFPDLMRQHQRISMAIMGPFLGAAFGLIQGLFAFVASRLVKRGGNRPVTG